MKLIIYATTFNVLLMILSLSELEKFQMTIWTFLVFEPGPVWHCDIPLVVFVRIANSDESEMKFNFFYFLQKSDQCTIFSSANSCICDCKLTIFLELIPIYSNSWSFCMWISYFIAKFLSLSIAYSEVHQYWKII